MPTQPTMASPSAKELKVKPENWETSPSEERTPLSDMDHTMPKIYVLITETFDLPEDADQEAIVKNLTEGLAHALFQFPVLAGELHMDANDGRMWVTKKREASVSLHVKYYLNERTIPSFAELDKKDFPPTLYDSKKLFPGSVTEKQLFSPLGDNADEGTIVSTFQINIIRGGLILSAAIHHAISDGPGCDGFLCAWAANSAAAAHGQPFHVTVDPASLDRSALNGKGSKPSAAEMEDMEKSHVLRAADGPPPAPPADFVMPKLTPRIWHVPRSRAEALKKHCQTEGGGERWLSTYDAIMALMWSGITRAKMDLLHPDPDSKAMLVHAVNTRRMWTPPLPDSFLGNAVALPWCSPRPIRENMDPTNLPLLADAVRQSITAVTPSSVSDVKSWVSGLDSRLHINIAMNSFLGPDLAGTSWQAMKVYEKHDFGFGLPRAVRWPNPMFEGYVFVLPSRRSVVKRREDEGIELCVCLEEKTAERLTVDEEMLRWAEPRGM